MIEETIQKLRARAVDRRLRDINMVGEANVKPIEHFFDWKSADEIERLRERVAEMQAKAGMYHCLYDVAAERLASARKALGELHALVWGECPSLLNEDSGGDAKLDLEIRTILSLTDEKGQS